MSDLKMRKAEGGSILKSICRWGIAALWGAVTLTKTEAVFPPHPSYSAPAAISGQILSGEGGAVVNLGGTVDYFTATNKFFLWNKTNRWVILNNSTDPIYFDTNTYAYRLTNAWANTDPAEISAAYNFDIVRSFDKKFWGHDSFDGNGAILKINVHALTGENTPSFAGGQFWLGDGTPFVDGPAGVLDLCGAAYADAMITSLFDGYRLNPESFQISFCNIFAFLAEYHNQSNNLAAYPLVTHGASDWYIGEDMKLDHRAIYDMRNPGNGLVAIPRLSVYPPLLYSTPEEISGIQDAVFFYMAQTYLGNGIGIDAAGQIAYRALTQYFNPGYMSFLNARKAWLQAADDLDFTGLSTNGVASAMIAWDLAGVPDPAHNNTALLPVLLDVFSASDFLAGGLYPLGPIAPTQKIYWVFNPNMSNETWKVTSSVPWAVVAPTLFDVVAKSYTNVNVSLDTNQWPGLGEGYFSGSILFTNVTLSNKVMQTRNITVGFVHNYQPAPAVYSWRTPTSAPTYLPLGEDQVSGPISVPFTNGWRFFAERRNQFYVGANGVMGVNPAGMDGKQHGVFPRTDAPNGLLAPLWDDWVPATSSTSIFYFVRGTVSNHEWVVTWNDLRHYSDPNARASFQVVISEAPTNRNNQILFQYRTLTDQGQHGAGRSATVGIEDRLGYVGGMYSSNGSRWVAGERAILYLTNPPPDVVAPTGEIVLESMSLASSSAVYVVRFSESVTNLTLSDFEVTGTALGSAVALEGAGMVYRVTIGGLEPYGTLFVGISTNAVFDEAGHPNGAPVGPYPYTIPMQSKNPADDFETGSEFWSKPVTNYANALRDVWQRGTVPATNLPGFAYLGTQAWMAVVTNDDFFPIPQDAWVESAQYQVGTNPEILFSVWYDTQSRLIVEAYDGTTWRNVTPDDIWEGWINADLGDAWTGQSYYWFPRRVALDSAIFGNRKIRVRFRLVGYDEPGIRAYIDSFQVVDALNPGVYIMNYTPTNLTPSAVTPVNYTIYNSYTTTVYGAVGLRSISDPGVTLASPMSAVYGDLAPGALQAESVDLNVGSAAQFQAATVRLLHTVTNGSGRVGADVLDFTVLGVTNDLGICRLIARGGVVTNWMGQPLYGDGSFYSCIYQIIDAGADLVISSPTTNGTPTGDDQLLYVISPLGISSFGRIGDAAASDAGRFEAFTELFYPIPTNRLIYARAWDSDNFGTAIAYGDSSLVKLATNGSQMVEFGDWVVGTAIKPDQDTDGDSIPDGYCVTHALNARWTVESLVSGMDFKRTIGTGGTGRDQFQSPVRVVTTERFMFVLDNGGSSLQVWNLTTLTNIYRYTNGFSQPYGLALDPRPGTNRVAIADTGKDRIQVLQFDPVTGTNWTWLFDLGSRGSADGQLYKPSGVAIGPDGSFYVADTRPDWDAGHSRISVFDQSGAFITNWATYSAVNRPYDTAVTPGGVLYIVNTESHMASGYTAVDTPVWNVGVWGVVSNGPAYFNTPRGVQNGIADRVYVADTLNHRIKVYDSTGLLQLVAGEAGAGPGQLNTPWDIWPSTNDNRIYVADTANGRIQIFTSRIDRDRDGMDDVWEDAVGLDSSVNDALAPWGIDDLSNIGAYRLGLQPGEGLEKSLSVITVSATPVEGGMGLGGGSFAVGSFQSITAAPSLFWRFSQWTDGDSNNPRSVSVPAVGSNYVAKFEKDLAPITLNRFLFVGQNLSWNATNQGVYSLEYSTNLAVLSTSKWTTVPGPAITSIVNGFLVWTNTLPITNNPVFYRVKWINAP